MAETKLIVADERIGRRDVASIDSINPMQMLSMAVRQGVGIEQLTKLMDLRDRWEASEARKAFDSAIAAAKAQIKPIVKNREVDFTSSKGRTHYQYEDLAGIAEAIDPILAANGLSYRHRSKQDGTRLTITCIVSHRAGHFEETSLAAANDESGNKNSIQGIGSTATYLQRYTLKLALGLSAAKDDDANTVTDKEFINADQVANIRSMLTEVGADEASFLRVIKGTCVEEIPSAAYKMVIGLLEAKRKGAK